MTSGVGQLIQANDYNTIRNSVVSILGSGTYVSQQGYGQASSITSAAVTGPSPYEIISHTDWDNLRTDMALAYLHQNGTTLGTTAESGTYSGTNCVIPATGNTITEVIRAQYAAVASRLVSNKFTVASTQVADSTLVSTPYTIAWNHTLVATATITFASSDACRWFFNAGGKIRISATNNGSTTKDLNWQGVFTTAGESIINAAKFYTLTTSQTQVNITSGTGTFASNYYQINAYVDSSSAPTVITVISNFADVYAGNPDDNIDGTTTSIVKAYTPSGSSFTLSAPTAIQSFSGGAPISTTPPTSYGVVLAQENGGIYQTGYTLTITLNNPATAAITLTLPYASSITGISSGSYSISFAIGDQQKTQFQSGAGATGGSGGSITITTGTQGGLTSSTGASIVYTMSAQVQISLSVTNTSTVNADGTTATSTTLTQRGSTGSTLYFNLQAVNGPITITSATVASTVGTISASTTTTFPFTISANSTTSVHYTVTGSSNSNTGTISFAYTGNTAGTSPYVGNVTITKVPSTFTLSAVALTGSYANSTGFQLVGTLDVPTSSVSGQYTVVVPYSEPATNSDSTVNSLYGHVSGTSVTLTYASSGSSVQTGTAISVASAVGGTAGTITTGTPTLPTYVTFAGAAQTYTMSALGAASITSFTVNGSTNPGSFLAQQSGISLVWTTSNASYVLFTGTPGGATLPTGNQSASGSTTFTAPPTGTNFSITCTPYSSAGVAGPGSTVSYSILLPSVAITSVTPAAGSRYTNTPMVVSFTGTNVGTGGLLSYQLYSGSSQVSETAISGAVSSTSPISYTFTTIGTYYISVQVISQYGVTATARGEYSSNPITIAAPPNYPTSFTASQDVTSQVTSAASEPKITLTLNTVAITDISFPSTWTYTFTPTTGTATTYHFATDATPVKWTAGQTSVQVTLYTVGPAVTGTISFNVAGFTPSAQNGNTPLTYNGTLTSVTVTAPPTIPAQLFLNGNNASGLNSVSLQHTLTSSSSVGTYTYQISISGTTFYTAGAWTGSGNPPDSTQSSGYGPVSGLSSTAYSATVSQPLQQSYPWVAEIRIFINAPNSGTINATITSSGYTTFTSSVVVPTNALYNSGVTGPTKTTMNTSYPIIVTGPANANFAVDTTFVNTGAGGTPLNNGAHTGSILSFGSSGTVTDNTAHTVDGPVNSSSTNTYTLNSIFYFPTGYRYIGQTTGPYDSASTYTVPGTSNTFNYFVSTSYSVTSYPTPNVSSVTVSPGTTLTSQDLFSASVNVSGLTKLFLVNDAGASAQGVPAWTPSHTTLPGGSIAYDLTSSNSVITSPALNYLVDAPAATNYLVEFAGSNLSVNDAAANFAGTFYGRWTTQGAYISLTNTTPTFRFTNAYNNSAYPPPSDTNQLINLKGPANHSVKITSVNDTRYGSTGLIFTLDANGNLSTSLGLDSSGATIQYVGSCSVPSATPYLYAAYFYGNDATGSPIQTDGASTTKLVTASYTSTAPLPNISITNVNPINPIVGGTFTVTYNVSAANSVGINVSSLTPYATINSGQDVFSQSAGTDTTKIYGTSTPSYPYQGVVTITFTATAAGTATIVVTAYNASGTSITVNTTSSTGPNIASAPVPTISLLNYQDRSQIGTSNLQNTSTGTFTPNANPGGAVLYHTATSVDSASATLSGNQSAVGTTNINADGNNDNTFTINTQGLAAGNYSGTISVSNSTYNTSATANYSFTIPAPAPTFTYNSFGASAFTYDPSARNTVQWNTGGGTATVDSTTTMTMNFTCQNTTQITMYYTAVGSQTYPPAYPADPTTSSSTYSTGLSTSNLSGLGPFPGYAVKFYFGLTGPGGTAYSPVFGIFWDDTTDYGNRFP